MVASAVLTQLWHRSQGHLFKRQTDPMTYSGIVHRPIKKAESFLVTSWMELVFIMPSETSKAQRQIPQISQNSGIKN